MAMVQLGLHSLCCNKCDFCLIEENHLDQMDDILVEIERAKENIKYIGTVQDVLVEGESKTNKELLSGRTRTNKVVIFEGDRELIGKEVKIEILSQHIWFLKGRVI